MDNFGLYLVQDYLVCPTSSEDICLFSFLCCFILLGCIFSPVQAFYASQIYIFRGTSQPLLGGLTKVWLTLNPECIWQVKSRTCFSRGCGLFSCCSTFVFFRLPTVFIFGQLSYFSRMHLIYLLHSLESYISIPL